MVAGAPVEGSGGATDRVVLGHLIDVAEEIGRAP